MQVYPGLGGAIHESKESDKAKRLNKQRAHSHRGPYRQSTNNRQNLAVSLALRYCFSFIQAAWVSRLLLGSFGTSQSSIIFSSEVESIAPQSSISEMLIRM
ncbi:hypothetical protein C8J23_14913 [Shewanella chilikensis]|uniref:Uncharacterized protein n=1 Tax=Shewanella chilikensis TaxID=558541 RepID=A0ABX5PI60_9GAMM|nr:hypothetical protein C8J23_14913 [Shewanella chilikensis]